MTTEGSLLLLFISHPPCLSKSFCPKDLTVCPLCVWLCGTHKVTKTVKTWFFFDKYLLRKHSTWTNPYFIFTAKWYKSAGHHGLLLGWLQELSLNSGKCSQTNICKRGNCAVAHILTSEALGESCCEKIIRFVAASYVTVPTEPLSLK